MGTAQKFTVECPVCNKVGEVVSDAENPRARCGDCLMDRTEIVEMKVIQKEAL